MVPMGMAMKVGGYVAMQHLKGVKRYPMVLMLEPLFRCNLACSGCGKIDYPSEILNQHFRGGGAGGQPDLADPLEPGGLQMRRVVDQVARPAEFGADFAQPV